MRRTILFLWVVSLAVQAAAQSLFLDPQFAVSVTDGIEYAEGERGFPFDDEIELLLDLYRPIGPGVPSLKPAFVILHDGGFIEGERDDDRMVELGEAFASRDYVCASIDYRLLLDNPVAPGDDPVERVRNAAAEDAANAVRWIRNNFPLYGIDPTRVAIGGTSAGAVTALFEAYRETDPPAQVRVVMDLWGGMYGEEDEIDSGEPPVFIVHGEDDLLVPFSLSEDLVDRLSDVGVPFEFYPIEGEEHGVDMDTVVGGITLMQRGVNFFYTWLDLEALVPKNAVPALAWRGY